MHIIIKKIILIIIFFISKLYDAISTLNFKVSQITTKKIKMNLLLWKIGRIKRLKDSKKKINKRFTRVISMHIFLMLSNQ